MKRHVMEKMERRLKLMKRTDMTGPQTVLRQVGPKKTRV